MWDSVSALPGRGAIPADARAREDEVDARAVANRIFPLRRVSKIGFSFLDAPRRVLGVQLLRAANCYAKGHFGDLSRAVRPLDHRDPCHVVHLK